MSEPTVRRLTAEERERLRRAIDEARRRKLEESETVDPADVELFAEFHGETGLTHHWQRGRA